MISLTLVLLLIHEDIFLSLKVIPSMALSMALCAILSKFSLRLVSFQVSHPYVMAGIIHALYTFRFKHIGMVLFSKSLFMPKAFHPIQDMMTDLNRESKKVGLKMNKTKTKVMFNNKVPKKPIEIEDEILEEVDEYINLGQLIKVEKDHDCEIKRRITIGWKAFGMNRDLLKSTLPMGLKRKVYNACIIPAMTYGCETWKLTKRSETLLIIAQRAMERAILGITLRDRNRSSWIRSKTRVRDIIQFINQRPKKDQTLDGEMR